MILWINVREYWGGGQKRTQRNWQYKVHRTKQKYNTTCVGHQYTQTNLNNVNKTLVKCQDKNETTRSPAKMFISCYMFKWFQSHFVDYVYFNKGYAYDV